MNTDNTRYLKLAKEPSEPITMEFKGDKSRHVIRPSKAFNGDRKGLCDMIAEGREYNIVN